MVVIPPVALLMAFVDTAPVLIPAYVARLPAMVVIPPVALLMAFVDSALVLMPA